jgi:hypothetical protein
MQGATSTGPLAWITSGKLDGVIDVSFPRHPDDDAVDLQSIVSEIIDSVQELNSASSGEATRESINPGQRPLAKAPLTAPAGRTAGAKTGREVIVDVDLRFRDLKAAVPYKPDELSYVNAALIRPIVAFIKCVPPALCLPNFVLRSGRLTAILSPLSAPTGRCCQSSAASSQTCPSSTAHGRPGKVCQSRKA